VITIEQVLVAMNKPTDEWISRRNKAHDTRQYEVVHDWGDGFLISEDTMNVVARYQTLNQAEAFANLQLQTAIAKNIIELFVDEGFCNDD
jgi:hypothetical protein